MYLNNLQQDEIFVPSEMKTLESITGIQSRRGLENVIVSNGKVVNVVSNSYGHIPNELFFRKAEQLLMDANLKYHKRTINRNDRSFITDFIIEDDNQFSLKNGQDKILPMLRFKNSYDGSEKTSGHFGFYREVCTNGLHVAQAEIAFSIKHSKNNTDLIMPSDKNDDPSKKSREVIELINDEPFPSYSKPNLWVGYNAFNWMLHNTLKKSFSQQEKLDKMLFDEIYAMV